MFRDFKYNPIDDARFALLEGTTDVLTDDEKKVVALVVNTFCMYGGEPEAWDRNRKRLDELYSGYVEKSIMIQ